MEFFMVSAFATIFCSSGPLFFVEVFTRSRRSALGLIGCAKWLATERTVEHE